MQGNFTLGSRQTKAGETRFYARWRDDAGRNRSRPLDSMTLAAAVAEIEGMNANRVGDLVRVPAGDAKERFYDHLRRVRSAGTLSYYRDRLDPLFAAWDQVPIHRWHRQLLETYIAERPAWSPRSVQMLVNACKRFIGWAREAGIHVPDFVGTYRGPAVHRAAPETMTLKELHSLIDVARDAKTRLEPAIALAGLAGLRHAEFMNLQAKHVDWKARRILVRGTKTHQDRYVPMAPRLQSVLKRHRRVSGPVVRAGAVGNPGPRLRDLKALCRKAGVPEVSWHPLRHTFATEMAKKHPLHVVQALLGHSNVSTTSIYLHAKDEDMRAAVEALG